jgi:hypothetical protein
MEEHIAKRSQKFPFNIKTAHTLKNSRAKRYDGDWQSVLGHWPRASGSFKPSHQPLKITLCGRFIR